MSKSNELHIYIRVSTDIQMEDGFGLENQRELGLKVSERLGLTPIIHNEGSKSSSKDDLSNRPKLLKLLDLIKDGKVKNLWVFRMDRLSRNENTSYYIKKTLKDNDVILHINEGSKYDWNNPSDGLMFNILQSFSEYDNIIRTDRFRRGRLLSIKKGGWKGGDTPFGYELVDKKLQINKYESEWIKVIFEDYSNGKSIYQIRQKLMRNGVLSRRGNIKFSEGSVTKILDNTVYGEGYYIYKDKRLEEEVKVKTPIIIKDRKILNKVRSIRKESKEKRQLNNLKKNTLLRDFLICGNCNSVFGQKINPKQSHNHYFCRGNELHKKSSVDGKKICVGDGFRVRSLNITETDELVWNSVVSVLKDSSIFREKFKTNTLNPIYESRKLSVKEKNQISNKIKKLEKEILDIDELMENKLVDELLGKNISDQFQSITKKLESKKSEYLSEIEELEIQLKTDLKKGEYIDWYKKFQNHIDNLDSIPLKDKKEFLNGVIENIIVETVDKRNHKLTINFSSPYFEDKLIWKNPKMKSLGYDIENGKDSIVVNYVSVDKRFTKNLPNGESKKND